MVTPSAHSASTAGTTDHTTDLIRQGIAQHLSSKGKSQGAFEPAEGTKEAESDSEDERKDELEKSGFAMFADAPFGCMAKRFGSFGKVHYNGSEERWRSGSSAAKCHVS